MMSKFLKLNKNYCCLFFFSDAHYVNMTQAQLSQNGKKCEMKIL